MNDFSIYTTIFGIGEKLERLDGAACGVSEGSGCRKMSDKRLELVIREVGTRLEEKDIYPLIKSGCGKYDGDRKRWDIDAVTVEEIVAFILFFRKLIGEKNEKEDFLKFLLSEKLNNDCFPPPLTVA